MRVVVRTPGIRGLGIALVPNTTLSPFGGFVDASGKPLYNDPVSLANAINANYAAIGSPQRVTVADITAQQKFDAAIQQATVVTTPATVLTPPPAGWVKCSDMQMQLGGCPAIAKLFPGYGTYYQPAAANEVPSTGGVPTGATANQNTASDGSGTPNAGATAIGPTGFEIIIGILGIGLAVMAMGRK